jgi:hypothetical protein
VDPSRPSFLDRSAEIRNAVYEILFKRDEPVLLHNAKAYHARPQKEKQGLEGVVYDLASLKSFDEEYEREIGQDRDFIHDFQLVTPFLLTCRQVYSETVGYLYGQNTFVFSRPLYRHDEPEEDNYCKYDTDVLHGTGVTVRHIRHGSGDVGRGWSSSMRNQRLETDRSGEDRRAEHILR